MIIQRNVTFILNSSMVLVLFNHIQISVSDKIARVFNRSGATRAIALDISKAFNKVWQGYAFCSSSQT